MYVAYPLRGSVVRSMTGGWTVVSEREMEIKKFREEGRERKKERDGERKEREKEGRGRESE